MDKFFKNSALIGLILVGVAMLGAMIIVSVVKLIIFLIIVFLITFISNLFISNNEEFRINLALGINPAASRFRLWEFIKFFLVWIIYLLVLINMFPGLRTNVNIVDFLWDTITLSLHVFTSTVYTKNGRVRVLYTRFSEKVGLILPPGYFLSPAIWFWYRLSKPMLLSYSENTRKLNLVADNEENSEDNERKNVFHLYKDDRVAKIQTSLKGTGALFYNFILLNSSKIRFTENMSFFRVFVSLVLAFTLNISLYYTVLNSYYTDTEVLNKVKTFILERNKDAVEKNKGISASFFSKTINIIDKTNNKEKAISRNPYISNLSWENLRVRDRYTVKFFAARNNREITVEGFFVGKRESEFYFPHVYVDGYEGDQSFFYNFFKVHIEEMSFKNGQVWRNRDMDLSEYISIIKNKNRIDSYCYRKIKIIPIGRHKGIIDWYLLDAGVGTTYRPFAIYYQKSESFTSIRDAEKFNTNQRFNLENFD